MLNADEAGNLCVLHAKVARAFAYLMREKEGTPAFKRRVSEWLQADLEFMAAVADLTD